MATITRRLARTENRDDALTGTPRSHSIDRWIFVLVSAWFIVVILLGFVPDSLHQIERVRTGDRPPFPLIMHLHAGLMGCYLVLLFVQTLLMATGRFEFHMRLGLIAGALAPALVIVGFLLAPTIYQQGWEAWRSAAPDAREKLQSVLLRRENVLLLQTRTGVLFALYTAIGLLARARDSGLHKRMMMLGPAIALPAAIDRITWLPTTYPDNLITIDLYTLVVISPMLFWDVIRNRKIHRAYWIALGAALPLTIAVYSLWNTPWWHQTARGLMAP